ncbi:Dimethyl sulfoxide reductase DmsA [Neobacillus rhizosphaerae]|uniref:Dimethyl sulfoxide reductase DmsA n=1 Tax=Neobacillus rhizosphaerae TaxID=2880965 RepID=A0ABN8KNI6_9BACI|nr:DMSO/selenate family reductase complex A subunit [Neobacillus rhizosphaerae]CAH2715121.1 Dimethyl sulfoxide reductase DmsA [Neobacillus rhizosphaerae]
MSINLNRRAFLKLSGGVAGTVAVSGTWDVLTKEQIASAVTTDEGTQVIPVLCNHNCGGRCQIKAHVKDGVVVRITTDDRPDLENNPQLRACLKGRATRNRIYHPDRLKYPMKRVGKRGEGKFKRITWDEATDLIAKNLKKIVDQYGPHSVYVNYATGDEGAMAGRTSAKRLMNLMGGYLGYYGSYSSACLKYTAPFVTGYRDTNTYQTLHHSKLIILSGFNPAETVFETNSNYYLAKAKKAGAKVIVIDPRYTESAATFGDQWIPIVPATDTALFSAMAYVIITENLHDQAFLDKYTIGFDEEHMPEGVPAGNSYKSYILGTTDGKPKTPEWAAAITGIDANTIINLAREYATTKPAQLLQGLGPQRHAQGESSTRAGIVLAAMTGSIGILGGGWGGGEGGRKLGLDVGELPTGDNPVETQISVFMWTDAVVRGTEMTEKDGVQNGPLKSNLKFMWNLGSNTLVNQHADINKTIKILEDESKLEYIVVSDQFMTPSAKYADILLPSDHAFERYDFGFPWTGEEYILFGNKAVEPPGECKHDYWWMSKVAEKLGLGEKFTEGKTQEDWMKQLVEDAQKADSQFPSWEELKKKGLYRKDTIEYVAFEKEIKDPANNPFQTPSGKIEIFSKTLFDMKNDEIPGVPKYTPAAEGPEDPLKEKYPLQCFGPHIKRRTHSTWDETPWMEEAEPQTMWINPEDAQARGLQDGDKAKVYNDRGALVIPVRVTKRIRPGVVSIPQGAWYTPDDKGVCQRGCINILTSQRPTPLAHGNGQHTNLVQVKKL